MARTFVIDESLNDTDFTAAGYVGGVFGTPRRIESISIHHWGSFGQTHDGVNNFFLRHNSNTSAHFVVSDGRITCLVSPADAAWAAGNAYGNATSIHIECRPEATDGDYETVAWLIDFLRDHYGANLPLIPHSYWTATACPGKWDLNRLNELAKAVDAAVLPAQPVQPDLPMQPRTFSDNELHWIVDPGDTLSKIAAYYGPTVDQFAAYNNINPNLIYPGQKIWVPGPVYWTVQPGDTLGAIANYYGITAEVVAANNGIQDMNRIYPGQVLTIVE